MMAGQPPPPHMMDNPEQQQRMLDEKVRSGAQGGWGHTPG